MLRTWLTSLLISLLFLPPGICVCAATACLQPNQNQDGASSQEDGLPDSHKHHIPGCPAMGPDQQAPRPEAKVQPLVPEQGTMLPCWTPSGESEFSLALPSAAESGIAATPLHILQRILLI